MSSSPKILRSAILSGSNPYDFRDRPRFGPVYVTNEERLIKDIKDMAWEHVTENKPGAEIGINSSVKLILRELRNSYVDDTLANFEENEFLCMMVKDGCFFLQLVLSRFGCPLGYPPNHPIFGVSRDENVGRRWLESMFIVGNQVPLLVFEKLMHQHFFEQAVERTTRWKKPVGLLENVLYEFLLVPASSNNRNGQKLSTYLQIPIPKPRDLLHGLYMMVLGPRNNPDEENGREVRIAIGATGDNAGNVMTFPSAEELRQAGIKFMGVEGIGSRGISFKPGMFKGILCLPQLMVDDTTELLFKNLEAYETVQQFLNHEIGSYLRLLCQLVRTIEDAKILKSQGVIKGQIEELPVILLWASTSRDIGLSRQLYAMKLQIDAFARPWSSKLKKSVKYSVEGVLLVGAVFTVLQYFKKEHSYS